MKIYQWWIIEFVRKDGEPYAERWFVSYSSGYTYQPRKAEQFKTLAKACKVCLGYKKRGIRTKVQTVCVKI